MSASNRVSTASMQWSGLVWQIVGDYRPVRLNRPASDTQRGVVIVLDHRIFTAMHAKLLQGPHHGTAQAIHADPTNPKHYCGQSSAALLLTFEMTCPSWWTISKLSSCTLLFTR